ncbi:MAG: tannase/feruloyl esterase family alpha/beta hydrolase [Gammaproteobacteria bacterium]
MRLLPVLLIAAACATPLARADAVAACERIADTTLSGAEVLHATAVPAGPLRADDREPAAVGTTSLPAHCRVSLVARPSPDSHIRIEVWMPSTGWNGRFEAVGNGNYAGMLSMDALPHGILRGSVIATTDTGHESTPADPKLADWAVHRGKLLDFGHRAIHEMARLGKALAALHYGTAPKNAYFVSCSNGGRQGLMAAQRHPKDFDGIVAGAPARSWTRLNSAFMSHHRRFLLDPASRLPPEKVELLRRAVLAACDARDGLQDGMVDDPRRCPFDDAVLRCEGADRADCLTDAQLDTVRALRAGIAAPASARLAGLPPGTESEAWDTWIFGTSPMKSGYDYLGTPFFRDVLHRDPTWTAERFDLAADSARAARELSPVLDADDPDLRPFLAAGGKLILYTGWLDPAIPALDTLEYYEAARAAVGAATAEGSMRLFMFPGVAHCGDGPGFSSFGQWFNGTGGPAEDIRAALIAWVEQGRVPDTLVATRGGDDLWLDPRVAASGDARPPTRLVCAYPKRARWTGQGSPGQAGNFRCETDGANP